MKKIARNLLFQKDEKKYQKNSEKSICAPD